MPMHVVGLMLSIRPLTCLFSGYRVEEKNTKTREILKGCRRNCFVRCTAFLTFLNRKEKRTANYEDQDAN
jgi:hypothetical protein